MLQLVTSRQHLFKNLYNHEKEDMNMSATSEILSMEELTQKFKNEWVVVEVIEDEFGEPKKVRVIAHSKNRDKIYRKQKKVEGDIAIFYTGEIPEKDYAVVFND